MGGASKPTLSKSVSMDVGEHEQQAPPIMEDEYIEMDAVIHDPMEKTEPTTPSHGRHTKLISYSVYVHFRVPWTCTSIMMMLAMADLWYSTFIQCS